MSKRGKILIMDDEEIILDVSRKMLSHLEYEVTCTKDGASAVKQYEESMHAGHPFNLVIMDLTVPHGLGAREAMQSLKTIDPSIMAIVTSGKPNEDIMINYQKYGFIGAIAKPFSFEELNIMLEKILQNRQ